MDGLSAIRWEGRKSHIFRIKDEDDLWRTASIITQIKSWDGTRCQGLENSLHCLSVPCPISPLLYIGTFCLFIFTSLPYSFFSPRFLGILFTFKYPVNNDFFEGFPDPSGGLRNLFFQILICFNLESLFCLKNHCFSIFSHWNHQGNFNTLMLQPHPQKLRFKWFRGTQDIAT